MEPKEIRVESLTGVLDNESKTRDQAIHIQHLATIADT
jgi:hypothetical protein